MAQIRKVVDTISDVMEVPRQTVDNLARRLGEAGMLPRGPRGRHAPHFEARHIVRVMLGTMVLTTDALNTPVSRVPAMVRNLQALESGPAITDSQAKIKYISREKTRVTIYSNTPFADALVGLLREQAAALSSNPPETDNKPRRSTPSVGIRLASGVIGGILNLGDEEGNFVQLLYHAQEKGLYDALGTGLVREAWISAKEIQPIAALLNRTNGKAPTLDQIAND